MPGLPDDVVREAYSHEVHSCGLAGQPAGAVFRHLPGYAYPQPMGFETTPIYPKGASYHSQLKEFILPYDTVPVYQHRRNPLYSTLQSTYEASGVSRELSGTRHFENTVPI